MVKRYSPECDCLCPGEDENGDFVKHSDYEKLEAKLRALIETFSPYVDSSCGGDAGRSLNKQISLGEKRGKTSLANALAWALDEVKP